MSGIMLLYSTFASKDEAISAARTLLAERLIACANIVDSVTSLYRWEGAVQQEGEVLLLVKTTSEACEKTIQRLKALHSYEVPCIMAYPAIAGFAPFMQWVEDEVR